MVAGAGELMVAFADGLIDFWGQSLSLRICPVVAQWVLLAGDWGWLPLGTGRLCGWWEGGKTFGFNNGSDKFGG